MVIVPLCGNGIGEERGDFGVGEGEACAGGDEGGRKGPFYPLSSDSRDLLKLGKMLVARANRKCMRHGQCGDPKIVRRHRRSLRTQLGKQLTIDTGRLQIGIEDREGVIAEC